MKDEFNTQTLSSGRHYLPKILETKGGSMKELSNVYGSNLDHGNYSCGILESMKGRGANCLEVVIRQFLLYVSVHVSE
jgi:hypothetical protein